MNCFRLNTTAFAAIDVSLFLRLQSLIFDAQREAIMTLTKRQKEVLDFLVTLQTKHGHSPSFEETAKSLKLNSLATVHKHISTLERKGFIRRAYNQSRSIEVLQLPRTVREQI